MVLSMILLLCLLKKCTVHMHKIGSQSNLRGTKYAENIYLAQRNKEQEASYQQHWWNKHFLAVSDLDKLQGRECIDSLGHFVSPSELWVAASLWAGVCPRPSSCFALINVHSLWGRWPAEVFAECLRVVDPPTMPRSFFCVQSDWSSIPKRTNMRLSVKYEDERSFI